MKLNLRAVDLNLLPVFAAVVEEGQLSRAADRLAMSQPAVSAALQRLRLTVDDPLFVRTRAGLAPTPRGRELYETVSQGLGTLAEALDPDHGFDPAVAERTFRIVAVDYFETLMLGPLISRLREVSDGVSVQVLPQQEGWQRQLVSGEVDYAFDTQVPEDDRIRAQVVGDEQLVVVARRDHPSIREGLTLEAYLAAEHVVLPLRERRTLPLDQLLGRPGWKRKIGAQVVQYSNLLAVAGSSDLIATAPRRLAERYAAFLGLQVLPFPVTVPRIPIYLISPKALERDQAHAWFGRQLTDALPY